MEMNGYDRDQSAAFFATARERVLAVPGVEAVANMSRVPQAVNDNNFGVVIEGHQTSAADRPYVSAGAYVDEHYFETLQIPIVRGRGIELADRTDDPRVAVVSEAFGERYWPGEAVVGQQFRTGWDGDTYVIVGVSGDYRVNTPGEAPTPYVHLPYRQRSVFGNFVVRTTSPAANAVIDIEAAIRSVDAEFLFLDTGAMSKLVDVRLFPIRLGAWLIGAFGILALVLAAIGLYGVIGYSVSRRTREIGIRMALGARADRVLGLVLRQGMSLVLIGALVGAVGAAILARLLASVLFVPAIDPASFLIAFGFLAAVALLANWVPAARAARVDPMIALRSE